MPTMTHFFVTLCYFSELFEKERFVTIVTNEIFNNKKWALQKVKDPCATVYFLSAPLGGGGFQILYIG